MGRREHVVSGRELHAEFQAPSDIDGLDLDFPLEETPGELFPFQQIADYDMRLWVQELAVGTSYTSFCGCIHTVRRIELDDHTIIRAGVSLPHDMCDQHLNERYK